MSGEITPSPPPSSPQGPPPWWEQFLQNQSREIDLRFKQTELEEKKQQNWLDYSNHSLEVQLQDRRESRTGYSGRFSKVIWLIAVVVFLLLAFLTIVILSGHADIALELVRVVIYGGAGYFGGWGVAQKKNLPPNPPAPQG